MKCPSLALILVAAAIPVIRADLPIGSDSKDKKKSGTDEPRPVAGVGLLLAMLGDKFTVMKVMPGTPAADAGLTERLVIVAIDGVSIAGRSQADCAASVRGLPGTKVKLELLDPDRGLTISVELTRRWIR